MTSNAVDNRWESCMELRRSLVKTLGEKRSLLLRLQKEQSRVRKLLREAEKGRKRDGEVIEVNKKWKEDYDTLKIKYETENEILRNELDRTKEKLAHLETQVLALGTEVARLAATLNELYKQQIQVYEEDFSNERRDRERAQGEKDILQQQLTDAQDLIGTLTQEIQEYEKDFSNERRDRERAQGEKDILQQQLTDAQDLIGTLTQEVEIYKSQLNECQEETRELRCHNSDPSLLSSCPQLQTIYPVNGSVSASQWQRRQEQIRRGILTRGANHYPAPPSLFYGGDEEVMDLT